MIRKCQDASSDVVMRFLDSDTVSLIQKLEFSRYDMYTDVTSSDHQSRGICFTCIVSTPQSAAKTASTPETVTWVGSGSTCNHI